MAFAQISLICAKILCGLKKKIEICTGIEIRNQSHYQYI